MELKENKKGIIGVVADIIKVEKKYEVAIETALGGNIQNIVTDTETTAKEIIEYLKKNKSRIEKSAQRIYKQKIKGYKQPYLNRTVDFFAAEKFCTDYEMEHYGKHYNRFPDDE